MWISRVIVKLLYFLLLFLHESSGQRGFCPSTSTPVTFCKISEETNVTQVYVDTLSVPLHQVTLCQCTIYRPDPASQFSFEYYGPIPKNMVLKINEVVLDERKNTYQWSGHTATLTIRTTKNYTNEGSCLIISAESFSPGSISNFTINCTPSRTSTPHSGPDELSSKKQTVTESFTKRDNDDGGNNIIIPIVAAVSGLVIVVVVILSVVFCRRRLLRREDKPTTSADEAVAKTKAEEDYYMTENPMHGANEEQAKPQNNPESEYNYIEHDKHGRRPSTNHYESLPDYPLRKQFPVKETDKEQHYDYSTVLSTSKKDQPIPGAQDESKSLPIKTQGAIEQTYDTTDKTLKPFIGVNEYHHLSPLGSRKNMALNTYNTIGSVEDNKTLEKEEELSEYNVANLR